MNCEKLYNSLISKAMSRNLSRKLGERHHIKPKCEGGEDRMDNLVVLTCKEHYIAHLLLAKWKGGIYWLPITLMSKPFGVRSSNLYQKAKDEFKKHMSESMKNKAHHLRGKNGDHHYNHYNHGKIFITDGCRNKMEYEALIPEGWVKGITIRTKRRSPVAEEYERREREGLIAWM